MKILECKKIDIENHENILFIRIDPEDLSATIKDIIASLSNLSWIAQFDSKYIRGSFQKRAQATADYLAKQLGSDSEDKVTKDTGEYVVSELAREALVNEMKYLDVPLAELFKEQVIGNPGFDFYSANTEDIIIFGEAKYVAAQNAYGKGMEQVSRFIDTEQDISDLVDIDKFFKNISLEKANNGEKAYAIAFSSKKTETEKIIKGILENKYYKKLVIHKQIIFLAVNV